MLVIDPAQCIDCGVCEPECPAEAIIPDTDPAAEKWLALNTEMAKKWRVISTKGEPPADAEAWRSVENKYEQFFAVDHGADTAE